MQARVDAGITLPRTGLSPRLEERLCRALSFPNPAYLERRRMRRSTWGVLEELCFLEQFGNELRLPRGAVHLLKALAAGERKAIRFDDHREVPADRLPAATVPLRDYQEQAVKAMVRGTQGTVVVPCGGGKTRIGIGAIASVGTPTLVLVHTLDLAEQWSEQLRSLLHLEAGFIGDGEDRPDRVTVAVIQALSRWDRPRLETFVRGFGMVLLDEAHHVGAPVFRDVIDRCPARYRFGLTATPDREDGLTPLLELFLGRTLASVTHEDLVAAGVLKLPTVRPIDTAFSFEYLGAEDYARLLEALVHDEPRNVLIADHVAAEAQAGHLCLALSGRVDHCETICTLIRARGVAAEVLTGELRKARRAELLAGARNGRIPVLVATTLADEGLDLPALSRVFLTYPGRARGRTLQRLGRLMRTHPGKNDAVLFDFVDRNVPLLRRHHLERRRLYRDVLGACAEVQGP